VGLIADIYVLLRPLSAIPAETFRSLPQWDDEQLLKFESALSAEGSYSTQRKVVRDALKDLIGVDPGQWFSNLSRSKEASIQAPQKLFLQKGTRSTHNSFVDLAETTEDVGIHELFKDGRSHR
jgi:hypothetical protein